MAPLSALIRTPDDLHRSQGGLRLTVWADVFVSSAELTRIHGNDDKPGLTTTETVDNIQMAEREAQDELHIAHAGPLTRVALRGAVLARACKELADADTPMADGVLTTDANDPGVSAVRGCSPCGRPDSLH